MAYFNINQPCLNDFDGDLEKYDTFLSEKLKEINMRQSS
jgi:hypothetical protein